MAGVAQYMGRAGTSRWYSSARCGTTASQAWFADPPASPLLACPCRTPLAVACQAGEERAVRMLLALGADAATIDSRGRTAVHAAALASDAALAAGVPAVLQALAQAGAPLNAVEPAAGRTALHLLAARRGSAAAIDMLLQGSANAYIEDQGGQTPLGCALAAGNTGAVELLLLPGEPGRARGEGGRGLSPVLKKRVCWAKRQQLTVVEQLTSAASTAPMLARPPIAARIVPPPLDCRQPAAHRGWRSVTLPLSTPPPRQPAPPAAALAKHSARRRAAAASARSAAAPRTHEEHVEPAS